MEEDSYFVIAGNEDGDVYFNQFNRAGLLSALNNKDWGDIKFVNKAPENLTELGPALLIIRGEIVIPEKEEVVMKYTVD